MFGKLGDMMGKLQEMKQRADEIKTKLDAVIIKSEAADGDIKIEITGNRVVKSIFISAALQHGNKENLESLVALAVNKAIAAADKANEEEMKKDSDYTLLLKLEHQRSELEKNMNDIMEELKRRHLA
jgi:DNA-binding YbaB/EbfC family protein